MEPKAALVRTEGAVELHTETIVDLKVAGVIFPDHSELDHALRNGGDLEGSQIFRLLLEQSGVLESGLQF